MIDPHVHLRDGAQQAKETLRHGLRVAYQAGLDGVFEMPNTDPPLVSREALLRRIEAADAAMRAEGIEIFHGVYGGLTREPKQIEEMVASCKELFPRVVGLKMFAGHSTGNMGITGVASQGLVYRTLSRLGYVGVLAVHCEKEKMLKPETWDPRRPESHSSARPPAAEVASVDDQMSLARAARFAGTLHVCHISTPWALDVLRGTHQREAAEATSSGRTEAGTATARPRLTCGLTPHHALLDAGVQERSDGVLWKVNPPLRPVPIPAVMLRRLLDGDIDWIETDHAPHTREDKLRGHASGLPVLPFYPRFIELLRRKGIGAELLVRITHDSICRTFGLSIRNTGRAPDRDLAHEYPWDPFAGADPGR